MAFVLSDAYRYDFKYPTKYKYQAAKFFVIFDFNHNSEG